MLLRGLLLGLLALLAERDAAVGGILERLGLRLRHRIGLGGVLLCLVGVGLVLLLLGLLRLLLLLLGRLLRRGAGSGLLGDARALEVDEIAVLGELVPRLVDAVPAVHAVGDLVDLQRRSEDHARIAAHLALRRDEPVGDLLQPR